MATSAAASAPAAADEGGLGQKEHEWGRWNGRLCDLGQHD
jgi:hypothetical protein